MLLMPVNNVVMVMRHSFFKFMSILMYVNVTRLFIVIRVLVIFNSINLINIIMFIRFTRIVATFRIIYDYEVFCLVLAM